MSNRKFLIKALEACEKPEFDKIVNTYLREVHDYTRISLTDGKDDAGLDIKVFDPKGLKIQYQLTVQKSETVNEKNQFEKKLLADLGKAKTNAEDGYRSNNLFFFYSKTLTNKVIRGFEKKALADFGINLTLIEANRIADEAEDYLQLRKAITDTTPLASVELNEKIFPNAEKNLVFDLVSFGKPSDFRMHIVESFVLELLFKEGSVTVEKLKSSCKEKFNAKENDVFYEKLIARLQTNKKIAKSSTGHLELKTDERLRINSLKEKFDLQEKEFIAGLTTILTKYGQEKHLEDYALELKRIYVQNFNSDIIAVVENLGSSDMSALSRSFLNFITARTKESPDADPRAIAISLFEFCKENNFIQKFCAGKVFSETTNLTRIERYVNTQKRVFIDTQVALHGLCYFYDPKLDYPNYYANTTKSLLRFCRSNKIILNIPDRYLWEVQTHVRGALNLIPFTQLPNFEHLGKSRNVLYNFYLYLKDTQQTEESSYRDFLNKFGFKQFDSYLTHNAFIEKHLKSVGIDVIPTESGGYDIDTAKRVINIDLAENFRNKTKFTLDNDAIILEFLSDNSVETHPLQPIFLSWDRTFFRVQKEFFRLKPNSQRWFLLTPGRFIDQYSLLQFTIDSEVLTSEVLALISDDIIQSTHSLLDTVTFILNPNDEVGLEYTNRLAQIRDDEIHRIQENSVTLPDDFVGEAVIDDLFHKLFVYYEEKENDLESFKEVFTNREFIERVLKIVTSAIEFYYEKKRMDDAVYREFDDIIKDAKKK